MVVIKDNGQRVRQAVCFGVVRCGVWLRWCGGALSGWLDGWLNVRVPVEFWQVATNVWTLIKFLEMAAWWRPTALSVECGCTNAN